MNGISNGLKNTVLLTEKFSETKTLATNNNILEAAINENVESVKARNAPKVVCSLHKSKQRPHRSNYGTFFVHDAFRPQNFKKCFEKV